MRKTVLTALSTAILVGVLGASSLALASERDEAGGYKIGPLGQVLGTPSEWSVKGTTAGQNAYGFVPSVHNKQPVRQHTN
jgi:hypothetical protein